ncbi:DsbE family thiol:disulfide interchange protein [Pseudorhodobacter ferrugineus]|uniref:DsbE family thiol:disulfide interchange protein n=1 Tax=Pseudorhodobacter ferrugineus TaxID=77008 RepID=UPI0003B51B18|nr:DsbE family thiol:disulfide interchange protein [Pseudorhodobacter ferrugineus]
MAKVLMFLPPLAFAGLAALFIMGMNREDPDTLPSALSGKPAPAVQVTPLGDGAVFGDAELRVPGVKLVNFFASWCAPCRVEHPFLEQLAAEGITIYGVNYKDRAEDALGFLGELGNPYTAIGQDQGRMALDWGVYGVPETYVIDGDGQIVLRFAGPITAQELERQIRPAIAEALQ